MDPVSGSGVQDAGERISTDLALSTRLTRMGKCAGSVCSSSSPSHRRVRLSPPLFLISRFFSSTPRCGPSRSAKYSVIAKPSVFTGYRRSVRTQGVRGED